MNSAVNQSISRPPCAVTEE